MLNIKEIVNQVTENCNVSDARHSGLFSICGLALRLRDLYKWENELNPWVEKDSSQILDWIDEKEQLWERIAENDLVNLTISGTTYDPFETEEINEKLIPDGLFYGAGFAQGMKPTFFLAKIDEKRKVDGKTVYILGKELARDLLTLPAMHQDGAIIMRKKTALVFFWDQMMFVNRSGRFALEFALDKCGIGQSDTEALKKGLDAIFPHQELIYIHHEVGEMTGEVFDRQIWREIVAEYQQTPGELLARAVKDLLADTGETGTLRFIVRHQKTASLGLYVAFLEGLSKALFPELRSAFYRFVETGDWEVIEKAVDKGYETARGHAEQMMEIYREGKKNGDLELARKKMEMRLIRPYLK